MSLSSTASGNRPPTLSASSISTLGEDPLSNPQGQSSIIGGFTGLSSGGAGASSPQPSQIRRHSFSRESPSYPYQPVGWIDTETHWKLKSGYEISTRNGNDTSDNNSFLLGHHDRDEPLLPSSLSKEALGGEHQNLFHSDEDVSHKQHHGFQSKILQEANDHPVFTSSLKDSIGGTTQEDHQDMKGSGLLMNNNQEGYQSRGFHHEEHNLSHEPFHNNYHRNMHIDYGSTTNGDVSSTILGSNSEEGSKQICPGRPTIRTTFSLNNMSIVKENEEYIESRSRAASVGHNYNNKQKWHGVENGSFADEENSNHATFSTRDLNPNTMYASSRVSQQTYQVGNYYRSRSEVPSYGTNQDEFRPMTSGHDNHHYVSNNVHGHHPRQRVMSADQIYNRPRNFEDSNGVEPVDRRSTSSMGTHEGQNQFLFPAQHSNESHGSILSESHQRHNRPRSHSSGARLSGYPGGQNYLPSVLSGDKFVSDNSTQKKSSNHRYASIHRSQERRGVSHFLTTTVVVLNFISF